MRFPRRLNKLATRAKQMLRLSSASHTTPSTSQTSDEHLDFVCNVCGRDNLGVARQQVSNREYPSCHHCNSSLRMRSVIHALAIELFGKPLVLPEFPADKTIFGLGMSDWDGYAKGLAKAFSYTNTFYHTEPRLDITAVPDNMAGQYRFLISSDVFEHIPVLSLDSAFRNSRRLLGKEGLFLFTVPFTKTGKTVEHFPNLNDFRIIETAGKRFLYNKTQSENEEIFDGLIFHGGDGMTLEMRIFSEPDLVVRLKEAGFSEIRIYSDQVPDFGIIWPMDWAVPIIARV